LAALSIAGCAKKAEPPPAPVKPAAPPPMTVPVVKEAERSRHFVAVNRQLELGGTLYAYADVDGDMLKLANGLGELLKQVAATQPRLAPHLNQDYGAIFTTLGLTDVKAFGLSSVPDGTGFFRNRVFFYTPESRHGLLAGFGGKPGPFVYAKLAPADADVYGETEVDVPAVYQTIKEVVARIGGEKAGNALEEGLKKAGQKAAFSLLSLINDMKGHAAMVLRFDQEKTFRLPGPAGVTIPAFSLLYCVDGVGPAVEPALAQSKVFAATQEGTLKLYELKVPLPFPGLKPIIAIDGSTLYFATARAFLDECRAGKTSLAQAGEFQRALARVGPEGNGLVYVAPRFFTQLQRLETLNANAPAQTKTALHFVAARLPKTDRPLVTVRTNLPDGILVRGYWNRSLKQDVAVLAMYNPVTIGVMAAMAIPAFQKVRQSSQQKAVLNNLRQLAAAADQYYLEQGVTTATYDDLVGPDKYVKRIVPVAGEDYRSLEFRQGETLRVKLSDGRAVEYKP
jgi:type IV pilus assembly protein PilA